MKYYKYKMTSKIEAEKGYFVHNYFDDKSSFGYSVVRTHLEDGKHPLMLNKSSNRTYYLLSGSAKFVIEGEEVSLKSDEMLVIPKNTKYEFSGNFDAILIDCPKFNPKDDIIFKD